jgi:kumamolisin
MKKLRLSFPILLTCLLAVMLLGSGRSAGAAPPAPRTLPADSVPLDVRSGAAHLAGPHPAKDTLLVLFMLPLRDWDGLNRFLADVSDPHSPNYGHYLTEAEVTARFGPEAVHADHVAAWLRANGITDVETPADRLYVMAKGSTGAFARLLNVQINDYTMPGRQFYAPDRPPTLPAAVAADIHWISGLDSDSQIHTGLQQQPPGAAGTHAPTDSPPYIPAAYQAAYDTTPVLNAGADGTGTNIAITLWTLAPTDLTLQWWELMTQSPAPTRENGRLEEIFTEGTPSSDQDDGEAAMDIEFSSGMAPAAHIRYYEATSGQDANLAHALDVAGSDPTNRVISNSWGEPENADSRNTFEPVLATHSASGHTYFFSSGDNGSWARASCAGNDPWPDYPTSSAYVVSVGGTRFSGDIVSGWPGEQTWLYNPTGNVNGCTGNPAPEGSGGGYSQIAARPAWQAAAGLSSNMRAYPDIAADADPETGAFVCSDYNGCIGIGGTSLAAPLWAGMTTIMDQYLAAHGRPHLGFLAPTLYGLAATNQPYPPFHDITQGTNGAYPAGPGWDAVTGLGSPDLANLTRDLENLTAPPPTPTPPRPPAPTATPRPGPTATPGGCNFSFSDVHPADYFYTPVMYLACHGAISGYADGTFRPGNNTSRGQLSKIIVAAEGWPINVAGGPHFTDVPPSNPFYSYIETAYNHGIISGYADGTFRWGANLTRGQLSKIIVAAEGWPLTTAGGPHFSDVPPSNPFYQYIETAYSHGIISGYADNTFRWGNNATRGQISKIVYLAITGQ